MGVDQSRAKRSIDKQMLAAAEGKLEVAPWRIHDLRRTIATGMERLGIRLQVVELLLGHTAGSRGGVIGVYQQHTYGEEKRTAIEKWAQHLSSLLRRTT